jgi:RHS repeat-associated protein
LRIAGDVPTQLENAKARMYARVRGRFLQPDPLGLGAADVTDPQSLNRYNYVRNDPVNSVDPSGLRMSLGPHPGLGSMDGNIVIAGLWNEIKDGDMVIDYKFIGVLAVSVSSLFGIGGGESGGGGGGGGESQNPTPTPTPAQQKPIWCQPDVIKAMKTAWAQSGNGTTSVEAGFRLDGNPSKYKIVPNAYTNETKQQTMTVSGSTFAIFHVHPTNSGGKPSTPENNAAGNNEGDTGLVDRFYKQGQHIQIYVMHRYGLTMYDPKNPGQMPKLRDNLDWTKPCPP